MSTPDGLPLSCAVEGQINRSLSALWILYGNTMGIDCKTRMATAMIHSFGGLNWAVHPSWRGKMVPLIGAEIRPVSPTIQELLKLAIVTADLSIKNGDFFPLRWGSVPVWIHLVAHLEGLRPGLQLRCSATGHRVQDIFQLFPGKKPGDGTKTMVVERF